MYWQLITFAILVSINLCELKANNTLEDTNDLENTIITLSHGRLRGKDNDYYYSFESIPYAEPPVDDLRFETPMIYSRNWEDIFDASKPPSVCMQWDQYTEGDYKLIGVEDCLTVNIYKPKSHARNGKFPVLILIHGGAFMFGSVTANSHEHFMRSGRVMIVKMTYRLGPLGFLSTEDASLPGNYGLKDQRLALQWIHENIGQFGGDPNSMMVLGFSAGGAAVHLQMLNQNFTKYAKVAASFSGTALNPWVIQRNSRKRAIELAKHLECPNLDSSAEIKKCLKQKPAKEIVSAVRNFLVFGYNPFTTFGPVVEPVGTENAFLTRSPEEIIQSGEFAQIPWLTSYAAQDGGYNAAELLQKRPRREELIEELNERWFDLAPYIFFFKDAMSTIEQLDDYSMDLKRHYLGEKDFSVKTYLDVQHMYTDILFKNAAERAVRLQREHISSPVYVYIYDNPADEGIGTILAQRNDIKLGTNHGDDFFLIFHNPARAKTLRSDEQDISQKFIKMLEDFVTTNSELKYGHCTFVPNVGGKENLELMFITKDNCERKTVPVFP